MIDGPACLRTWIRGSHPKISVANGRRSTSNLVSALRRFTTSLETLPSAIPVYIKSQGTVLDGTRYKGW